MASCSMKQWGEKIPRHFSSVVNYQEKWEMFDGIFHCSWKTLMYRDLYYPKVFNVNI